MFNGRLGLLLVAVPYLFAFTGAPLSTAAQINAVKADNGATVIQVSGDILPGDADRFAQVAAGESRAVVAFSSFGGSLADGLAIGRTIKTKGFFTAVPPGLICASACALAWAAGSERYMAPDSLIGFHAAWTDENGQAVTSGAGNALAGAYMAEIGFSDQAIIFATTAGPDGMTWLSPASAAKLGIAVHVVNPDGTETTASQQPLQLPRGYRWIVLASAKTADALPPRLRKGLGQFRSLIVQTSNGNVAAVVGPFTQADAEAIIQTGDAPADAFLSSGRGFVVELPGSPNP